jgi:hypothetical protein
MPVRCLTIINYGEPGQVCHFVKSHNPTWEEIVTSIYRLDKFRYPWVWLFIGDDDEDASVDCLTVMGGDGVFWVGLTAGKYDQRCTIRRRVLRRLRCGPATRVSRIRKFI